MMDADFIFIISFMVVFGWIVFTTASNIFLVWSARRTKDERFSEISKLNYFVIGTPGELRRAIDAYMSAYKAAPKGWMGGDCNYQRCVNLCDVFDHAGSCNHKNITHGFRYFGFDF